MKDYSQYGEQPIILETLAALGIEKGHLVDLGAGDGYTMSNSRALLEQGWTGDLYDGDPKGAKDVTKLWIDAKTIIPNLMKNGTWSIDFLSIDLDGNDYHVLDKVLESCSPHLVVTEINPIFQRDEAVVMPYNPSHVWAGDTYYGQSLAAVEQLAAKHGYTLMYLHHSLNAFLLRNDHAAAHPELIQPIEYQVKVNHRPHPAGKQWQSL